MAELLPAAFGELSIGIRSLRHEHGQDWAEHSPTRGSDHTIQPRGKKLARTSCEVIFLGNSYLADHARFAEMVDGDEPRIFVHPVRGSYLSVVRDCSYEIDDNLGEVRVQCTFLEYRPPEQIRLSGSSIVVAGSEAVTVAQQRADAAAAAAGVTVSSPSAARDAVSRWDQAQIDARTLELEVSAAVAQIDEEIARLHAWAAWPVVKELVRTRQQVLYAADSIVAQTDQIRSFTVETSAPLLTIAAALFGGELARAKADEIQRLNGLRDPGLVRAGITLKVPA